jgi:hypothetical protein
VRETRDGKRAERRIGSVRIATAAPFVATAALALAATPSRPRAVCGAHFAHLPSGWHQSGAPSALVIGGVVPSNTDSWAATPRSVFDLTRPLPRSGIYIWIDLRRPRKGPSGPLLRLPLRLRDARVIEQEGAPKLPEFRFQGRYKRQYDVTAGVDFGRASPSPRLCRLAGRLLRGVVFPRWVPFAKRSSCRASR